MKQLKLHCRHTGLKIKSIFLASAIFFLYFSFFGTYEYKIYSKTWFFMFFVYELLFFCGLSSGNINVVKNKRKKCQDQIEFSITQTGALILWIACILSLISFVYFLFLYRHTLGNFVFGTYTADLFDEGRTSLEKITLLLMQIGGDSAFLILSVDKTNKHKRLKKLSHLTLFLPGFRYLLMGSRFMIATEFLMLFAIKMPLLKKKLKVSIKAKRQKRIILVSALILGIAFLYLFASRSIYYTALERKAFFPGDMTLKPFWKNLYDVTDGKIDFLCVASDYLGEAPYVFSYYCKYNIPEKIAYGLISLRSIVQIINNLTGLGPSYNDLLGNLSSGQYSGFAYVLIADFGVTGSLIMSYLYGFIFAKIERYKNKNRVCCVIYPAIKVICFFAPIFFFYVGRMDYTILFCVLLALICLKKTQIKEDVYGEY